MIYNLFTVHAINIIRAPFIHMPMFNVKFHNTQSANACWCNKHVIVCLSSVWAIINPR